VKHWEGLLRQYTSEIGDKINRLVSEAEMGSLPDPKQEDSEGGS
jgi:hypothetical protein